MTFKQLLEKHLESLTQAELGARLGLPPDKAQKYISMWRKADGNSALEKHWKLFKTIALDLDPLALFDDEPITAEKMWHYLYLLVHFGVPEEKRRITWERIQEKIEDLIEEEAAKAKHDQPSKTTKPRRLTKIKTRC